MENNSKKCSRCKTIKPLTDFWRNRATKDGFQTSCKVCHGRSANSTYRKMGARNRNLWVRYKITPEQFEVLFEAQNQKCAICKSSKPGIRENASWNVDHDHTCCPGEKTCGSCIRGILCAGCNMRLGLLEGTSGKLWFKNVQGYLRKSNSDLLFLEPLSEEGVGA